MKLRFTAIFDRLQLRVQINSLLSISSVRMTRSSRQIGLSDKWLKVIENDGLIISIRIFLRCFYEEILNFCGKARD